AHVNEEVLEINVLPLDPAQLTSAKARSHVQEQHHPFPQLELGDDCLKFSNIKNIGHTHSLRTLADARPPIGAGDRVIRSEVPPDSVIKQHAHQIADFRLGSARQRYFCSSGHLR